mmetsp:Transcript_22662/g.47111  ORF Transcript_22662/g.47111 Transcript_22662/m.47111 type:complete len:385 (-) Transcript_22662:372-1526(-)
MTNSSPSRRRSLATCLLALSSALAANNNSNNSNNSNSNGNDDDAINVWTDYAILPQACVTYNSNDVIVYSMYAQQSRHCTDSAIGTYAAAVPTFVNAYLDQLQNNANDSHVDFTYPEMAAYLDCTYRQVNGKDYYLQVGCADDGSQALAVNIYEDGQCTKASTWNGYDDANVPVDLSIEFRKCTPCVIWTDKNDDEIDDGYYDYKMTNAPLCRTSWEYRQSCDAKCQMLAREVKARDGWNQADQILLSILTLFGCGMLLAILKKRQKMSNKDALLEQAAITAAGLQPTHILGVFFLLILVIVVFALLNLKKITWALLLLVNILLFAYLMKLTVDGSVKETIVGPDGKIVEKEESDDDEEEEDGPVGPTSTPAGNYENPNLPPIS